MKVGQFLAMRFDILPAEVCRQLDRLFDDVPPLSADVVREVIEAQFSKSVEQIFRDFQWTCIAAASVAQVHRAVRRNGEVVAVKIQRPGIARIFAADIRNFRRAAIIGDWLQLLGPQSIAEAVEEFARFTSREMDFVTEARTADRLRANAGPFEDAPRIHWDLTTSKVLTMEFVDGLTLASIIQLIESGRTDELERRAPGLDLQLGVRHFAWACMRQLFITGFFHADPHPGNIFLREDGTVVFVDFGIFAYLTPRRRETFASYIENVAIGNVQQSYRHFLDLLQPTAQTDFRQLRRDVEAIMRRWHEASLDLDSLLAERHLGKYFGDFITAIRSNNVRMSLETLLFWRALLVLDATALRFKGQFDLLGELREFFEQNRPNIVERMARLLTARPSAKGLLAIATESPRHSQLLLGDLTEGDFSMHVRRNRARKHSQNLNAQTKLLALTIAGGSLFMLATKGPFGFATRAMTWTLIFSLLLAALVKKVRV